MLELGVHYRTAWMIHSKIMEAICEREHAYPLRGKVQFDNAYLGENRNDGNLVVVPKTRFQSSQQPHWMKRGTR